MLQSRVVLFLHTTPTSVIVVVMDRGDRGDGPVCCCYYTTTITITTTTNTYRSQTPRGSFTGGSRIARWCKQQNLLALCSFCYMTQNQFVFWANSRKQHNFAMLFWDTMHFPQSEICVNHNYKVFTDPPQKHLKQGGRTVQKCRPPAGGRDRQKPRESHCHLPPTLAQLKLSMTLVMAMGNLVGWLIGWLIGLLVGWLVGWLVG